MKYAVLFWCTIISITTFAQFPPLKLPSSPKQIVVDSHDNVIVYLYEGRIMKIMPFGVTSYISEDIQKDNPLAPYPTCEAMVIDKDDNIFMAGNDLLWKMAPNGKVSLFAGVPFSYNVKDGPLKTAQFRDIEYMETDMAGNIYIAERDNSHKDNPGDYYLIRKITTDGNVITLTNTRDNEALRTNAIAGMGIDTEGNLYVSDGTGRCVKKLAPDGAVTVLAGLCGKRPFHPFYMPGNVSKAELMSPEDILVNKKGEVGFADSRLQRIIKIANNTVSTFAGNGVIEPNSKNMGGSAKEGFQDGPASTALFNFHPGSGMAIDSKDNIYIIDSGNNCIRKLTPDGIVSTIAKMKP